MRLARLLGLLLPVCCLTAEAAEWKWRERVVDGVTGRGIPGVRVTLAQGTTVTDSDGYFEYPDWVEKYEKYGYQAIVGDDIYKGPQGRLGKGDDKFLFDGPRMVPVVTMMLPITTLSGLVVDEGSHPIKGAAIVGGLAEVQTDSSGRFRMPIIPVDTTLVVTDPRCRVAYAAVTSDTSYDRPSFVERLRLTPGENHEVRIVVPSVPTYTVRGTVERHVPGFDDADLAITLTRAGVGLNIRGESYPRVCPETLRAEVLPRGASFEIHGVPAGKYSITAYLRHRDVNDCDYCPAKPAYQLTRNIEVSSASEPVLLKIYPGTEVTRSYHIEGIAPRNRGLEMPQLEPLDGEPVQFGVAQDRWNLAPGTYRISIPDRYAESYLREVRLNGVFQPGNIVKISPEMRTAKIDLYATWAVANWKLEVTDLDGHPVSSYTTALLEQRDGRWVVFPHGARGGYPPGRYKILAITPAYPKAMYRPELIEAYAERGTVTTLTAETTMHIRVVAVDRSVGEGK